MHTSLSSIVPTILLIIHHNNSITNAKSITNLFIRKGSSSTTLKTIGILLSHNDDFTKHNENTKALHSLLSIRAGGGGKRDAMKKKKKKRKSGSGQSKDGGGGQKGLESSKSVIKEALKEDAATAMGDAIR